MVLFSDYAFDGTDPNFWFVPDAYYHPVRPFKRIYDKFLSRFEVLYEKIERVKRGRNNHLVLKTLWVIGLFGSQTNIVARRLVAFDYDITRQ